MSDTALDVRADVWPHDALRERIDRHDVAVYTASLRADADTFARALDTLDAAERERYARHLNTEVARRYAVSRLRLREMLGAALDMAPADVPIRLGLHGKPAFAHALQSTGVRFSLAHCEDLLVVAVTRVGEIGIDLERVRSIARWPQVAERVFSAADRVRLTGNIADGVAPEVAFFRFWCRTEAELKAIGSGISGLTAHRDGWRPPGLRIVELPELPLPVDHIVSDSRYQAAVAVCASRDSSTVHNVVDVAQARKPSITPTSASTA
jgi:4'-phosphopantetheinyl transferase